MTLNMMHFLHQLFPRILQDLLFSPASSFCWSLCISIFPYYFGVISGRKKGKWLGQLIMFPWKLREFFMLAPHFLLGENWNDRIKIQKVMSAWPSSHYRSMSLCSCHLIFLHFHLLLCTLGPKCNAWSPKLYVAVETRFQVLLRENTELSQPFSRFIDSKVRCALV